MIASAGGAGPSSVCLGGNVFGWTATNAESVSVLDAFRAAGGNFVDTADTYSAAGPGMSGGESEEILGRWMRRSGCREQMIIATKVGIQGDRFVLTPATIEAGHG